MAVTARDSYAFDAATAVSEDAHGVRHAEVDPSFGGFFGAAGGYVAVLALRAMTQAVADPTRTARSLTVALPSPATDGRLGIDARREAVSRSLATASARLEQAGQVVGVAQAVFGASRRPLVQQAIAMPDVPPPEKCEPLAEKPIDGATLAVEHRPAAPPLPLAGATESEILVWMRLGEGRPVDHLLAAFLADGAVPALYASLTEPIPIPTIELSVQFVADDYAGESEWVLGHFRNRVAGDGYAFEDGELWTPEGRLLVQARQLRRTLVGR